MAERSPQRLTVATTREVQMLTRGQIDDYHDKGFVVIRGAMPKDEMKVFRREILKGIDEKRRRDEAEAKAKDEAVDGKPKNVQWPGSFVTAE